MSVEFCGLRLAHPVINGSGTFDAIAARRAFGDGLLAAFPFAAYVSKTITLEPRPATRRRGCGRPPAGMINSIGLPNKGLQGYLREDLPELAESARRRAGRAPAARAPGCPLITNVMGSTAEELARAR